MSTEHLFPRFHIRPPRGYLNDPNGPILVDETFHLYFQYRQTTDHNEPVQWGHATSTDLVHWTHQRPAITPHPVLGDRDGCWSGNTVLDDRGRVRAFYSGLRREHIYQSVLSAVSTDGGYSFGDPVQVVADPDSAAGIVTLRDPFVWRETGRWLMVVGAGHVSDGAAVRLYTSTDLDTWEFAGNLAVHPRTVKAEVDTGEMWECPQVIHLAGQLVLLVGAWTLQDGTMRVYSVATTSDGATPGALTVHLFDEGPDFYAASALRDSPAGTLVWGWATEARDYSWCIDDGWSGLLTLPRVVRPHPTGRLTVAPLPALADLRQGGGRTVGHHGVDGLPAQLELEATVEQGLPLIIRVRFSSQEYLQIGADRNRGVVEIDRSRASTDPRAIGGTIHITDAFENNGAADIRVFLDGSILEVFTSGGRVATVRCYPTAAPPYRVEVTGGGAEAVRLWRLGDGQVLSPPAASSQGRVDRLQAQPTPASHHAAGTAAVH